MVSRFKFESKDQREGWLAFVKWCKDHHRVPDWEGFALFAIQKDHESQKWLIEFFGSQLKSLEDQVYRLQSQLNKLTMGEEQ